MLLWIDVDTGMDDALALLYLTRVPEAEIVGVSAVAGNVDLDRTTANSLAVLELAGRSDVPVHRGASRPLLGMARPASAFHGEDGLGGIPFPTPSRGADPVDAVSALRAAVRAHPGAITLLAVGPLTNVALFIATHPEEAAQLREIVVMGGARFGGNATAVAEFNVWHDPEAAHIVVASGIPVVLYPLELFAEAAVPADTVGALVADADPVRHALGELLARCSLGPGLDSVLGDGGAAVVALRRDLATIETHPAAIDLAPGLSRGALLVDARGRIGEHEQHGGEAIDSPVGIATAVRGVAEEFLSRF